MNVITVSVGGLSVFRVEHDDRGLWLSVGYGHPESFWGSDKHFVFVRPANNLQQSWRFDWEPPKAVLRDIWTIDWILGC